MIDEKWEIREGDVLDRLREMDAQSVHTCISSPPYWGLRDYGTAEWEGGDSECDHLAPDRQGKSGQRADRIHTQGDVYRDLCGLCGAKRIDKQIGLEETPEEFVAKLVEVYREIRRVLRDDGTIWVNLGDSYTSGGRADYGPSKPDKNAVLHNAPRAPQPANLKLKDLVGIPWRVAFGLQSDGWYLRSDIIWHKPNPMPESVTDRPTKAHEYIFLLSKQAKYYYDADAIREGSTGQQGQSASFKRETKEALVPGQTTIQHRLDRDDREDNGSRNKRTVWTIPTEAFPEAHFATFPKKLVEPCILAGCPEGGTVLDPFSGSGTTGLVALRHGRNYIGIELNPEYAEMSRRRIENDAPLFN